MKKYIIYKHTNIINGKCYIGQTCQAMQERSALGSKYKNNGQKKFYNAIKKYGWGNFTHEVIEDNIPNLEEALLKESYYIKLYDSFKNGYNSNEGGLGNRGHKISQETKDKISQKNKGKTPWNKGKHLTEEQKEHLRMINLGRKDSEETKAKKRAYLDIYRKNRIISEETRKKLSESHIGQKGYWDGKHRSEETKEKIRQDNVKNPRRYWLGKKRGPLSEETKKKISESLKRRKENESKQ